MRVLISAGPTREPVDAVRFVSNYSTGYMGAQLAREALARGHQVTVVSGPTSEPMPRHARVVPVERAAEMARALRRHAGRADAVLMAAAVADFRPAHPRRGKVGRRGTVTLRLVATPDVLAELPRRPGQVIAGFALETGHAVARARRKLQAKHAHLMVAQQVNGHGTPFGRRPVRAWLVGPGQAVRSLGRASKGQIARALLDKVEGLCYGREARVRRRAR